MIFYRDKQTLNKKAATCLFVSKNVKNVYLFDNLSHAAKHTHKSLPIVSHKENEIKQKTVSLNIPPF